MGDQQGKQIEIIQLWVRAKSDDEIQRERYASIENSSRNMYYITEYTYIACTSSLLG